MSIENYNIRSGDDYADLLIGDIKETNDELGLADAVLDYWFIEIRKICNKRYLDYVEGSVDSFMLSEEDMIDTYKEATLKYTGDLLAELVDSGEVSVSINEDGEMIYSAKNWNKIKEDKTKKKK